MLGTGNGKNSIEPIILLLCGLVIFYTIVLVIIAKIMSSDGQTFQIIAGLVTGFSGSLLTRIKPRSTSPDDPDPVKVLRTTDVHTETQAGDK